MKNTYRLIIVLLAIFFDQSAMLFGQSYVSYFTGNPQDTITVSQGGVCMMGGRSEQKDAMRWFLERAQGGDVLVLRASGSDGYNDFLYQELGVNVNSVESIVFKDSSAAWDPVIHKKIAQAEAIWLAGGNQWKYVSYWRNTPIDSLIRRGIRDRQVVIGGTSAGMAVLGGYYFAASQGSISSAEAMEDPFSAKIDIDHASFLQIQYLENVITDTHYDGRMRMGRHLVFMARAMQDTGREVRGIACDEYTALCINPNGIAEVYGAFPEKEDFAYFIQTNCQLVNQNPEQLLPGKAFSWDKGGKAVLVEKLVGTPTGSIKFDLKTWRPISEAIREYWSVKEGVFLPQERKEVIVCPH